MARLWMVIGIAACLGACSQETPQATNATAIAEQPAPPPEPAAAIDPGRPTKRDRRQLADWNRWSARVDDDQGR